MNDQELKELIKKVINELNIKPQQEEKLLKKVILNSDTLEIHLNRNLLENLNDELIDMIIELCSK